jgi:hypothetical protein
LRYFITFACYDGHLHGDEAGSVDRYHNLIGSPLLKPDSKRAMAERRKMLQNPNVRDEPDRTAVLDALRKHCAYRAAGSYGRRTSDPTMFMPSWKPRFGPREL